MKTIALPGNTLDVVLHGSNMLYNGNNECGIRLYSLSSPKVG
jgi:hypothetical protein